MSHSSRSLPRPSARFAAPLTPIAGFLLATALLVARTPVGGPLYDPALLPDRVPLGVAGADPLVALASIGIGQSWLYVTGLSGLLLGAGVLAALVGPRFGTVLGDRPRERGGRHARSRLGLSLRRRLDDPPLGASGLHGSSPCLPDPFRRRAGVRSPGTLAVLETTSRPAGTSSSCPNVDVFVADPTA